MPEKQTEEAKKPVAETSSTVETPKTKMMLKTAEAQKMKKAASKVQVRAESQTDGHWSCAILVNPAGVLPKSCVDHIPSFPADDRPSFRSFIFILDSLRRKRTDAEHQKLNECIQSYVTRLYGTIGDITPVPTFLIPVPRQEPGSYDCGPYMLHFVKRFVSDPMGYTTLAWKCHTESYPRASAVRHWDPVGALKSRVALQNDFWR
ncbi:hypothetical protein PsYK624_172630 [Phanerochaete sordida]|uniref:Ubiquitin-like protease family profile domain-containing protein n=1 Tax=Phanerochaete sordida TaxID=48140 RepID=A0A9P3GTD3_9APHY|nr:hypothetical protein PsYK624_172630 [Phanerochaete sordida]